MISKKLIEKDIDRSNQYPIWSTNPAFTFMDLWNQEGSQVDSQISGQNMKWVLLNRKQECYLFSYNKVIICLWSNNVGYTSEGVLTVILKCTSYKLHWCTIQFPVQYEVNLFCCWTNLQLTESRSLYGQFIQIHGIIFRQMCLGACMKINCTLNFMPPHPNIKIHRTETIH